MVVDQVVNQIGIPTNGLAAREFLVVVEVLEVLVIREHEYDMCRAL